MCSAPLQMEADSERRKAKASGKSHATDMDDDGDGELSAGWLQRHLLGSIASVTSHKRP